MSNAQDLLSILNGARSSTAAGPSAAASNTNPTEKSILSFKAGKMNTTLQPNGKFLVEPDTRRGELHVVWQSSASSAGGTSAEGGTNSNGTLRIEWRDRRTKTVVNTIGPIFGSDNATFERVETGKEGDRVYLLCVGNENRHFFWMQDKNVEPDEELCVKVNLYMSDNSEAASAAGTTGSTTAADSSEGSSGATAGGANGMDNAELLRMMQGALGSQEGGTMGTVPGNDIIPTAGAGQQIDALGNILETLGMPQPNGTPAGENDAGRSGTGGIASTTAGGGGGLTLSDLQGAMAGLATASSPGGTAAATAGPPLTELTSSDIIDKSGILDDKDTVERLIALLPEGQRTEEMLRENIRSPQVAQCLQRLTSALAEDAGSFNSIIANFQLNPADGMSAMASGNPIEAFLNCLLKDVEKKEGVKKAKTDDDKDTANDDSEEKGNDGGGGKEAGSGDGDVKMDES